MSALYVYLYIIYCFLYGFEPNEEEFKKLYSTDKKKYFNYAVGNGQSETLNICAAPGMTSVLEPDIEYLELFHGKIHQMKWNGHMLIFHLILLV